MRPVVWIACLWPGLAQAWFLGSGRGLGLAITYGAVLNAALVVTFVWPRWPSESMPAGVTAVAAWSLVLGLLVRGMWSVGRDWSKLAPPAKRSDPQIDDWFREAQHEYLKGHWIAAESLLSRLLARRPDDVEATLLLASVQRRSGQWDKAKSTLEELSHHPNASRWQSEMAAEQRQINEAEAGPPADQLSLPESTLRSAA